MSVLDIYRLGIATGYATFETQPPTWQQFMMVRMAEHRFVGLGTVGAVVGWIARNPVSDRSVYVILLERRSPTIT